jgi:hypothetical protein
VAEGGVSVWNGRDQQDFYLLQVVIQHNCQCVENALTCSAHSMLTDQRVLDRLAFVASQRQRFIDGEDGRR